MFPVNIDPASVAVCIVLKMILGTAWYSNVLFGKQWLKLVGKKNLKLTLTNSTFFLSAVAALVKVMATAVLVYWMGAFTWQSGLMVGLVMGLGIVAADNAAAVIWENKPLPLFLIDAGHAVFSFAMIGVVLAVMGTP